MDRDHTPEQATAQFRVALTFYQSGKLAEATAACERALRAAPRYFDALYLSGVLAMLRRDFAGGAKFLGKALTLNQSNAQAFHTHGQALWMLRKPKEAVQSFDRAIALNPAFAPAHNLRGNALRDLGRYEDALQSYEKAAALDPNLVDARFHLGLAHLQMGELMKGWSGFELHWQASGIKPRQFPRPQWNGEPLEGKTILLHDEQGLGDTLQFCRYVKRVAERGAKVILGVQRPLVDLLAGLEGVSIIKGLGDEVPPFDFHASLLTLPRIFKTDLASIPVAGRYLESKPELRALWQERLGARHKPRVGLVWSGAVDHTNDLNRSILLRDFVRALPPGFEYVSLQKELRAADQPALQAHPEIKFFGDELKDFTDTAALCDLMDIVISVDTSVAHLAGGLDRPTWILLPFNPDWRWMLGRADSPWYPSVRLFRQTKFMVWDDVLENVKAALAQHAG